MHTYIRTKRAERVIAPIYRLCVCVCVCVCVLYTYTHIHTRMIGRIATERDGPGGLYHKPNEHDDYDDDEEVCVCVSLSLSLSVCSVFVCVMFACE